MISSPHCDERRWIPERGFIVNLRRTIQKVEEHPYFEPIAEWIEPRQVVVNLCQPFEEFFMEDFIHDIEVDLGFTLFGQDKGKLERFLGDIRDELIEQIESIYGQTDNLPVFQRWLNHYDALFVSRQGVIKEFSKSDSRSHPAELALGRYRRLIALFKRPARR